MKTEEFDDAIRRKAESVYFNPKEEDIDRIHKHVSGNIAAPSFLKMYGLYTAVCLSLLIIGGLATWNIVQYRENASLSAKVEKLDQEVKNNALVNSNSDTRSNENSAVNSENPANSVSTASNENNTPENEQLSSSKSNSISSNATSTVSSSIATTNKYQNSHNNTYGNNSTLLNSSNTTTAAQSQNNKAVADNQNPAPAYVNNNVAAKNSLTNPGSANTTSQKNENSSSGNVTNEQAANTGDNATNEKLAKESKSTAPAANTDSISEHTKNSAVADNTPAPDNKLYSKPTKEKHSSSNFSLKNLHYMAGIGAEGGNKQNGFGIYGQVALSDRWSFGAGIKSLMVNNEDYDDDDDFHNKKGVNFKKTFGLTDTANIENIKTRDIILEIPLSVNYTLPLRNDFGLVFSAGTDIDLYAGQHVEYLHLDANSYLVSDHKDVSARALAFNNAVFAIGLQKRWGHFVAQAGPYVCPQFTPVVYKKEDVYAGGRLRLYYTFGG